MLSFGMAVCGTLCDGLIVGTDPEEQTFYRELRPISDKYLTAAVDVSGLDRAELVRTGTDPAEAMEAAATWVREVAGDADPVAVGFPLVFDWMFLHWYFVRFQGESPFGFSHGLDMKTMYQQKSGSPISQSGLADLPRLLASERLHTHNARDDAIEQGEVFISLAQWRPNYQ